MMGWSFLESPAITSSLECHPGCRNTPGRPSNAHGSGFAGPSGGAPRGQERKRLGGATPTDPALPVRRVAPLGGRSESDWAAHVLPLTWLSSSAKVGRPVEYSTLRPNSPAPI